MNRRRSALLGVGGVLAVLHAALAIWVAFAILQEPSGGMGIWLFVIADFPVGLIFLVASLFPSAQQSGVFLFWWNVLCFGIIGSAWWGVLPLVLDHAVRMARNGAAPLTLRVLTGALLASVVLPLCAIGSLIVTITAGIVRDAW